MALLRPIKKARPRAKSVGRVGGATPAPGREKKPRKKAGAKKSTAKKGRESARVKRSRDQLAGMAESMDRMKAWRAPDRVLTEVELVRTIFPAVDVVLGGGWPTSKLAVVHGSSGFGKTQFVLGLGASFLALDHFFGHVDAERTTDNKFATHLLRKLGKHPGFRAMRPDSYEECVDGVRAFCDMTVEARKRGRVSDDTRGLIVLDSLTKLVPRDLMKKLLAEGAGKVGVDGMHGAAGRQIAAMNAQWFRELTILLDKSKVAMVIVVRERQSGESGLYARRWKLPGGQDVEYEPSLVCRVTRTVLKSGTQAVAQRHLVRIRKSKINRLDGEVEAFFHTSPDGFDLGRDLIELGLKRGVLVKRDGKNSHYELVGDGLIIDAVDQAELRGMIAEDVGLQAAIEDACRR